MPGYRPGAEFELPSARLGDLALHPVAAPSFTESLRQADPEHRRRWLLWATLAVAVVVLALLAWRLARDLRTGRSPPPGVKQPLSRALADAHKLLWCRRPQALASTRRPKRRICRSCSPENSVNAETAPINARNMSDCVSHGSP